MVLPRGQRDRPPPKSRYIKHTSVAHSLPTYIVANNLSCISDAGPMNTQTNILDSFTHQSETRQKRGTVAGGIVRTIPVRLRTQLPEQHTICNESYRPMLPINTCLFAWKPHYLHPEELGSELIRRFAGFCAASAPAPESLEEDGGDGRFSAPSDPEPPTPAPAPSAERAGADFALTSRIPTVVTEKGTTLCGRRGDFSSSANRPFPFQRRSNLRKSEQHPSSTCRNRARRQGHR